MTRVRTTAFAASLIFLLIFLGYILCLAGHTLLFLVVGSVGAIVATKLFSGKDSPGRFRELVARRHRLLDWLSVTSIVWLAITLRLIWAFYWRIVPHTDYLVFLEEAQRVAGGDWSALSQTKSPVTVLWYSWLTTLPMDAMVWIYVANAALGGLQCYLVYRIGWLIYRSRTAAKLGALAIATFPTLVMHSGMVTSETPFATVLLLVLWVCTNSFFAGDTNAWRVQASAAAAGALAAILHLTRNLGVLYGAALLIACWIFAAAPWRRKLVLTACAVTGAFFVLLPIVVHNVTTLGRVSINSYHSMSLNLLFGTNMATEGQHSDDDVKIFEEYPEQAAGLAMQRIKQDPAAFLKLALGAKFKHMWCDDTYGVGSMWHQPIPSILHPNDDKARWIKFLGDAKARSGRFYYGFLLLTVASLLVLPIRSKTYRFYLVSVAGIVGATFLLHLVIEAQPRYHFFLPFVLAPLAGGILEQAAEDRQEASTSAQKKPRRKNG